MQIKSRQPDFALLMNQTKTTQTMDNTKEFLYLHYLIIQNSELCLILHLKNIAIY